MSSSENSDSSSAPASPQSDSSNTPQSPPSPVIEEKKYQLPEATYSNTLGNLGSLLRYRLRDHPLFEPALANEIQDYTGLDEVRFEKLKEYYGDDDFFIDSFPELPEYRYEDDPDLLRPYYESKADVKKQFRYILDRYYHEDDVDINDLVGLIHKFAEIYQADRQVLGEMLAHFMVTNPLSPWRELHEILDEWGYVIPDYMMRRR
jgi:hypothetical protein